MDPPFDAQPFLGEAADCLLRDGTYVEWMLEHEDHAAKIAAKPRLAQEPQIPLAVIGPTDMHQIGSILAAHVRNSRE
jgi:hypothetical protein